MTDCNHLLGMGKTTVRCDGEIIVTWLTPIRLKDLPMAWDGHHFDFCPDCGAAVKRPERTFTYSEFIPEAIGGLPENRGAEPA